MSPRRARLIELLLALLLIAAIAGTRVLAQAAAEQDLAAEAAAQVADDDFDFFSDAPVTSSDIVELPLPPSRWISVGGPLALIAFFFLLIGFFWWMVPFQAHTLDINLHHLPTGVKRGIAMATVLFGIAFAFGASEIWYQLRLHGSAEAYFAQMSLGKLIAFTHAHLFGFTTSFFIIGIPFSLQFNHLWPYQWVFPIGLSASLTDVISWWGIKYLAPSFEWVSVFCGILFSLSYLYMLVGLLRVLLFPEVVWITDKDAKERLGRRRALREASRHHEGDY
ncbi:hypothetical protein [Sinimarinibacterium thermocellulolyticum]|uniref:Uncharacterized protein n=1 Tax=Sinimarinibacterium thermocellulolyticum TaxID=3170016 RepID=A0ABV2AF08_9GAMM